VESIHQLITLPVMMASIVCYILGLKFHVHWFNAVQVSLHWPRSTMRIAPSAPDGMALLYSSNTRQFAVDGGVKSACRYSRLGDSTRTSRLCLTRSAWGWPVSQASHRQWQSELRCRHRFCLLWEGVTLWQ